MTSEPVECLTYSGKQAATVLGVSPQTVSRMVEKGLLPSINTATRNLVIPKWAVDQLVAPPATVTVEIPNQDVVHAAMREAS